ncbi:hypothetical protein BHM03_00058662 [Ensete ventricosum]|nr:hypothetical protein BHM03_00058662 [Ensete ventricosum]
MKLKAVVLFGAILLCALAAINSEEWPGFSPLVTKESRRTLTLTESGGITAVDVHDGCRGSYHLQFITLEPGSLFLPVLLHTDMLFYVHTGMGFSVSAYSNLGDMVRGFDEKVLQSGFGVCFFWLFLGLKWVPTPPPIVPTTHENETEKPNWKEGILEALLGVGGPTDVMNRKKTTKTKTYNFFKAKPDVANRNGWSTAVTHEDLQALEGSNLAPFMVNLTRVSRPKPYI